MYTDKYARTHTHIQGGVDHGEYVHFKVCVDDATQVLFSIKSLMGRAEMYIGNHENPFPSKENHTWSKVGHDKLTVFHLDRSFNLGYYYVGVYGQGQGAVFLCQTVCGCAVGLCTHVPPFCCGFAPLHRVRSTGLR